MQITLIRHGKPAVHLSGMVRGKDLAAIAKAYDISGIVGRPPPVRDLQSKLLCLALTLRLSAQCRSLSRSSLEITQCEF
jgi:hypothetical protein